MNRIHRVVFNHALGVFQAVCEIAQARGKSSQRSTRRRLQMAAAVAVLFTASGSSWADGAGGNGSYLYGLGGTGSSTGTAGNGGAGSTGASGTNGTSGSVAANGNTNAAGGAGGGQIAMPSVSTGNESGFNAAPGGNLSGGYSNTANVTGGGGGGGGISRVLSYSSITYATSSGIANGGSGGSAILWETLGGNFQNTGELTGGGGGGGGNSTNENKFLATSHDASGGNGGSGVAVSGTGGRISNLATGSIQGGGGGGGGYTYANVLPGAPSAMPLANGGNGGGGVDLATTGTILSNAGTIQGGNGGNSGYSQVPLSNLPGSGGIGVSLTGNQNLLINSGLIAGGVSGINVFLPAPPQIQANAVQITGNSNTLQLQAGYSFTGNVVANGTGNSLQLGGESDASFDLSGIGTLYTGFSSYGKSGGSTWTLTGNSSVDMPWTISAGTLALSGTGSLGSSSDLVNNGNFDISAIGSGSTDIGGLSGSGAVTLGDKTLAINPGAAASTFSGVISGNGGLTVNGGTQTLSGVNTYAGDTNVTNGATLEVTGSLGTVDSPTAGISVSNGQLVIDQGGVVHSHQDAIGTAPGGQASASISGAASRWTTGTLIVANDGQASLDVTDGAQVEVTGFVGISGSPQAVGTVNVAGAGSKLTTNTLFLGGDGNATVNIGNGGTVTANGTIVFYSFGGTGPTSISDVLNLYTGGTLEVGGASGISSTHSGAYAFNLSGGTLRVIGSDLTTSLNATLTNASTVDTNGFNAELDGNLTGTGSLTKIGVGALTLAGTNSYTGGTTINAGTLIVGSATALPLNAPLTINGGTLDLNGFNLPTLSLSGETGALALGAGNLSVNQSDNTSYAGVISGSGSVTKSGSGTLALDGVNTYTGTTDVEAGKLIVGSTAALSSASIAGPVTVASGATLGGHGSVGSTIIASGATLSPGNSIGTFTVNGNLIFASGSAYAVEVDPASTSSDLTHVTGTATLAGTVQHIGMDGNYKPSSTYTILTADGGIIGQFDAVTSSYVFLTPSLSYDANDVYLRLQRNTVNFTDYAKTSNQMAVASSLATLPTSGALANSLLTMGQGTDFAGVYDALSGEIHASAAGALLQDEQAFGRTLAGRATTHQDGDMPLWVQVDGDAQRNSGDGNAASARQTSGGLSIGAETTLPADWTLGGAFRYAHHNVSADSVNSWANIDSYSLGVYGGKAIAAPVAGINGSVKLAAGATYGWHQLDTTRNVQAASLNQRETASYGAQSAHAFIEAGYEFPVQAATVEPYVNVGYTHVHSNSFTEAGGSAALTSGGANNSAPTSALGVRGKLPLADQRFSLDGSLAWQHAYGSLAPKTNVAFADGGEFQIAGVPLARDAALVDLGLSYAIQPNMTLAASYVAQFGRGVQANGGKVNFSYKF